MFVLARISLLASIGLLGSGTLVTAAFVWRRAGEATRRRLIHLLSAGIVSGMLATGAYDLSRLFLVKLGAYKLWPFDIFGKFGQALTGSPNPSSWVQAVGFCYHIMNGLGFAIAYAICLGTRGIWAGILWALALETLMVSIYPGWLGLKALDEFLQISILGHLVYGSVLGFACRRILLHIQQRDALKSHE